MSCLSETHWCKIIELLGGRTAADNEKPSKQKKEKPAKVEVRELHGCYIYLNLPWYKSSDCFPFLIVYNVLVEDKKVADDNPVQPPEELNPFLIFPNPEENFKLCVYGDAWFSDFDVKKYCYSFF